MFDQLIQIPDHIQNVNPVEHIQAWFPEVIETIKPRTWGSALLPSLSS